MDEIATQADEHLGAAIQHRFDRLDHMVAVLTRRVEAEHLLHAVQVGRLGLLVDADGAVTLHVGVAADRPDAGTGLAEVAAQHQQITVALERM
ncbi:hypothetical protein G6F68_020597 [Rhizopus microsporus]|nr:hypothetical protein G6F68_020597 [Rhizopus microsporus]KAG1477491.1 hypothetical protein G6F54_014074 [Rhizopus delemar]